MALLTSAVFPTMFYVFQPVTMSCVQRFISDELWVDCANQHLTHVPRNINVSATYLVLSHNLIRKLKDGSFAKFRNLLYLDASYNKLETLGTNSFCGLNKLEILNISSNLLSNKDSFPKGVFKPLSWSLVELDFRHNMRLLDYTDADIGDLASLNILRLVLEVRHSNLVIIEFQVLSESWVISISHNHCPIKSVLPIKADIWIKVLRDKRHCRSNQMILHLLHFINPVGPFSIRSQQ